MNNFHVGWCPFCDQGWVDIFKDTLGGGLLVMCNECDTIWNEPNDIKLNKPAITQAEKKVEIPALNEIQEIGWDEWLVSIDNL